MNRERCLEAHLLPLLKQGLVLTSVLPKFISVLWLLKDRQAIFNLVEDQKPAIRKRLGNMIAKQLRVVPELQFFIDDSLDYAMKIEELLKK